MTDITPAPAAMPVPMSVSIPVPSAAVPPTTNTPASPVAAPEPAQAAPEKTESETNDDQPRGDDGKFKPKTTAEDRKARIQSDIDRMTAEKRTAEREVSRLREEAYRLQRQLQEPQAADADPYDPAHNMRKAVREDRLEQTAQAAQEAFNAAQNARSQMFMAKIEAAREAIPDLDQALGEFAKLPVTEAASDLIAESPKSAEIAYFLAKNPADAHRIARLPAHLQGAEIARIEAKVSSAPQPRKHSNAPPPPPMIGGTSSPTTKSLSEMGVEDIGKMIYGRA